ncbi:hypothetical protein STCU_11212 [Strigomonas culicis]|uniref:Uncharacterized protein n=1 Tax=Strigomonas culicis TaxID=28005 RepID=S9THV7_9TRYP|nr:hypothetical protein STCU_11212 [Strigomonas culicis]|eukprot:EPY16484.1 hypothetical protein STCU_11212 [Strigomonas culicis]
MYLFLYTHTSQNLSVTNSFLFSFLILDFIFTFPFCSFFFNYCFLLHFKFCSFRDDAFSLSFFLSKKTERAINNNVRKETKKKNNT